MCLQSQHMQDGQPVPLVVLMQEYQHTFPALVSQPLLVPHNNVGHFSILAKVMSANSSHSAMLMISSPNRGPLSS